MATCRYGGQGQALPYMPQRLIHLRDPRKVHLAGLSLSFDSQQASSPVTSRADQAHSAIAGVTGYSP